MPDENTVKVINSRTKATTFDDPSYYTFIKCPYCGEKSIDFSDLEPDWEYNCESCGSLLVPEFEINNVIFNMTLSDGDEVVSKHSSEDGEVVLACCGDDILHKIADSMSRVEHEDFQEFDLTCSCGGKYDISVEVEEVEKFLTILPYEPSDLIVQKYQSVMAYELLERAGQLTMFS